MYFKSQIDTPEIEEGRIAVKFLLVRPRHIEVDVLRRG